jgi:hypothetical protein
MSKDAINLNNASGQTLIIDECDITINDGDMPTNAGHGGISVYSSGGYVTIDNSKIYIKSPYNSAKGVYPMSNTPIRITNTTIEVLATATSGSFYGAAVSLAGNYKNNVTLINCRLLGAGASTNTNAHMYAIYGSGGSNFVNTKISVIGCQFPRTKESGFTQHGDIYTSDTSYPPKIIIIGNRFSMVNVIIASTTYTSVTNASIYMPNYSNWFSQTDI